MKKLIIAIIIRVIGIGSYFVFDSIFIPKNTKIIKSELENTKSEEIGENTTIEHNNSKIKARFSIRGIIRKGDYYLKNNEPSLALKKYNEALKSSPDDEKIIEKLAITYLELNNAKKAFEYYEKISSKKTINKEKYILSLLLSHDIKTMSGYAKAFENIKNLEILDTDEKFYFLNGLNCTQDFHSCKILLQKYIDKTKKENKIINYHRLDNLAKALQNFENFQTNDIGYKDALLVGAFYANKDYVFSSLVGEHILKDRPDYKPILKLVAKSYFEIHNLAKANELFKSYYSLEPSDKEITYILGIINFELANYLDSNIYFNAAIKNGYTPKTHLERRLAYNYFVMGDTETMLKTFNYLLKEDDATIDDYSLAIYNAMMAGEQRKASIWIRMGLTKFPREEILYGYWGWIEREKGNLVKAEFYLKKGLKINDANPMINLNLGYVAETRENYLLAKSYFLLTIEANGDGEFGILAQRELEDIDTLLASQSGSQDSLTGAVFVQ